MLLQARALLAGLRRADPVRADELAGIALLIGIELQAWLGPPVQHRGAASVAGVLLAAAVAVRRRWPLVGAYVAVAVLAAQAAFGDQVSRHAPAGLVAMVLLFYAMGAFLPRTRSLWALGITLAASSVDVLITPGKTVWDLCFAGIVVVLMPWALGRMLRGRAARERSHRDLAERLDADREQRAHTATDREKGADRAGAARRDRAQRVGDGDPGQRRPFGDGS